MQWVAIATTALGAYSAYQTGQGEKSYYRNLATQASLQGRVQAVQYEQQANDMLKASLETQAVARARAAAGGVDPFSGSAQLIQSLSAREGAEDAAIMRDNAAIARGAGETQAAIYQDAGRYARRRGLLGAATAIGQGAVAYTLLGKK